MADWKLTNDDELIASGTEPSLHAATVALVETVHAQFPKYTPTLKGWIRPNPNVAFTPWNITKGVL